MTRKLSYAVWFLLHHLPALIFLVNGTLGVLLLPALRTTESRNLSYVKDI